MDIELYKKTLKFLCNDPNFSKYSQIFKNLDCFSMIDGKYMIFPYLNINHIITDEYEYAKYIFSTKYNDFYNTKYMIDTFTL